MIKILMIFLLVTQISYASVLELNSNGDYKINQLEFSVAQIVKDYAAINKLNLIMKDPPKRNLFLMGPKNIKKEKIELFISAVTSQIGYTIFSNKKLNQIKLLPSRDVRYHGEGLYIDIKNVPDNYHHSMFSMKLKHVIASTISRGMRPMMSRYGRIIDGKNPNTLLISDTGKNIHRLHKLISELDVPKFAERAKFLEELNKKGTAVVETKTSSLDFIKDKHILFIFVFSLIGGILGFGIRGYMIKRIEGGW